MLIAPCVEGFLFYPVYIKIIMRKALLFFVAVLAFTGLGLADGHLHVEPDPFEIEYGEVNTIEIHCDDTAGNCPSSTGSYAVHACGQRESIGFTSGFPANYDFYVPDIHPCSVGEQEVFIEFEEEVMRGGYFTVRAKDMQPHYGKNLIVNIDDDNDQLRTFELTNDDEWGHETYPDRDDMQIFVQDYDGDSFFSPDHEQNVYSSDPGELMRSSQTSSVSELVTDHGYENRCGEDGDADTCNVIDRNFEDMDYSLAAFDEVESRSPIFENPVGEFGHEGPSFMPDGDVVAGYIPERKNHLHGGTDTLGGEGPYFFICREGADMRNQYGEEVPQVVEVPEEGVNQLFRCEPDTKSWVEVGECDTGLDFDGDYRIDHQNSVYQQNNPDMNPDDRCDTLGHPESPQSECESIVRYDPDDNSLTAEWNRFLNSDGECEVSDENTQTFDDWIQELKDDDVFEPGTDGVGDLAAVGDCLENQDHSEHDLHEQIAHTCDTANYDNYGPEDYETDIVEMRAGIFAPPRQFLMNEGGLLQEQIDELVYTAPTEDGYKFTTTDGTVNQEVIWNSEFVSEDWDGWTLGMQTLEGAHQKYTDTRDRDQVYDGATWSGRGVPTDILYDGSNTYGDTEETADNEPQYFESWAFVEPTTENQYINTDMFTGGFVPDCGEGASWTRSDQVDEDIQAGWVCEGRPDWQQAVHLPNIKYAQPDATVGMMIMPYNWKEDPEEMDTEEREEEMTTNVGILQRIFNTNSDVGDFGSWKGAFNDHYEDEPDVEVTRDPTLDEVVVGCHPADNGFRPDWNDDSKEGVTWFEHTVDIDTDWQRPLAVYGELEMQRNQTYRCTWEYHLEDSSYFESHEEIEHPVRNAGSPVHLMDNGDLFNYYRYGEYDGSGSDFDGFNGIREEYGYDGEDNLAAVVQNSDDIIDFQQVQ